MPFPAMKRSFTLLLSTILSCHLANAQTTRVQGPAGSGEFGSSITVLSNGNYVVRDPTWDNGPLVDVGAVYLYNGATHARIATLTGTKANDQVGSGEIKLLSDGNYLVLSQRWNNGSATGAGAVTWVSGTTGIEGSVNPSNSLVGSRTNDFVGTDVVVLENGNYVVLSPNWDNGSVRDAGAATWANGNTGVTGIVSASNSQVGSHQNDQVGSGVRLLSNGNYLTVAPNWDNGSFQDVGAVAWANGTTGATGVLSPANALVGANSYDMIDMVGNGFAISVLPNGNYVVKAPGWDNNGVPDAGAVTWGNGASGTSGKISPSNSLVGSRPYDMYEGSVFVLANGNYVVRNPNWDSDAIANTGAVTWGNGSSGTSGTISPSNSLVGSSEYDMFGGSLTILTNGNYVVGSPNWANGTIIHAGAATWGSGTAGVSGVISAANSLVGTVAENQIGWNSTALPNGNYVVSNPNWTNAENSRVGAATFGDGSSGIIGAVNSSNSLVGSLDGDHVGSNIIPLTNGNYVVRSTNWHDETGAATWSSGIVGITGVVGPSNSLLGSAAGDMVGSHDITPLPNGNYLVFSAYWGDGVNTRVGAVTWGNGNTGISGEVNATNSLVGSHKDDMVGLYNATVLANGNYVVESGWWGNGVQYEVGAVTWANGATGVTGVVSASNSLVGTHGQNRIGDQITPLSNGNFLVSSTSWDNGSTDEAGAITWADGERGVNGEVSAANSLVGVNPYDRLGHQIFPLPDGNYMLLNAYWGNGTAQNVGAITLAGGGTALSGNINECNSFLGTRESGGLIGLYPQYNPVYDYVLISSTEVNEYAIYKPLAILTDNATAVATLENVPVLFAEDCKPFAQLAPAGAAAVTGAVTAKVYVQSGSPAAGIQPYVLRHHEITPSANANTATGRITLYYLQADFDNFNALRKDYPALPQGPADTGGKANIRITQQHGTSDSGLPNSYKDWTGEGPASVLIDPSDEDIVWNSAEKRWEVSFAVTGFSGFFAHSTLDETPLPVHLVSFRAREAEGNALLSWETSAEAGASHFEVERSADAKAFDTIGILAASGNSSTEKRYSFTDTDFGSAGKIVYYRLRMVDLDGSFSHSKTVSLTSTDSQTAHAVFPNPAKRNVSVTLQTNEALTGFSIFDKAGKAMDVQGKIVSGNRVELNASGLSVGIYLIRFTTDGGAYSKKLIIE